LGELKMKKIIFLLLFILLFFFSCNGGGDVTDSEASIYVENKNTSSITELIVDGQIYTGTLNTNDKTDIFKTGVGIIEISYTENNIRYTVQLNWISEHGEYQFINDATVVHIVTEYSPADAFGSDSKALVESVSSDAI
jgi:hypothetical protein